MTLLFARYVYERVAETYIEALEIRAERGDSVSGVASVASFFVSWIDALLIEGVKQFVEPYQRLLESVERRVGAVSRKCTPRTLRHRLQAGRQVA